MPTFIQGLVPVFVHTSQVPVKISIDRRNGKPMPERSAALGVMDLRRMNCHKRRADTHAPRLIESPMPKMGAFRVVKALGRAKLRLAVASMLARPIPAVSFT